MRFEPKSRPNQHHNLKDLLVFISLVKDRQCKRGRLDENGFFEI